MSMAHDTAYIRCQNKIRRTRDEAIAEASRLGFPVAPYRCPNGDDHWHVGNSRKNGALFHNKREYWERQSKNKADTHRCMHNFQVVEEGWQSRLVKCANCGKTREIV